MVKNRNRKVSFWNFRFFAKNYGLKYFRLIVLFEFMFFCLEAKEPKIQDLETSAKILKNFLKSPNSGGKERFTK